MAVILITVIGSSDHDQITMGIETLRNIVIITTDIFAVWLKSGRKAVAITVHYLIWPKPAAHR